ncbi:MAG TPA: glycolate oxidase subunit GlcE [Steroidobacteraceae bacterium]|nr:glycolate oxidase subunit GlcE [Steroidobacteraceae bacterium]
MHAAADSDRQLGERIRAAAARGAPLRLRGAGTKDFFGESLEGEVLELRAHRGIVHYEPSELVITARCGTALSELERTLAREGQFLPCEPPRFGADPTVGGIIAAGFSGPRRMYAGAVRDFVLGARLIDARGEPLRFGGEVMKNVAGFDLARALCGSLGILGVISEVSFKVLPLPRAEATLCLELDAAQAVAAFNRWAGQPLPLSAAAWHEGIAWVRLSGAAAAVGDACARIGGQRQDAEPARSFWSGLRDLTLPFFARAPLWRVSLPQTAPQLPVAATPLIDWGGAVRWYAGVPEASDVRAQAARLHGGASCWRGPCQGPRLSPLPRASELLHRRLKTHFDPRGIFNRNRLLPGL